jgi:hypothetical protein
MSLPWCFSIRRIGVEKYERAILGGLGAVDHQPILWLHFLVGVSRHVPLDPYGKGGCGIVDQAVVEV